MNTVFPKRVNRPGVFQTDEFIRPEQGIVQINCRKAKG